LHFEANHIAVEYYCPIVIDHNIQIETPCSLSV